MLTGKHRMPACGFECFGIAPSHAGRRSKADAWPARHSLHAPPAYLAAFGTLGTLATIQAIQVSSHTRTDSSALHLSLVLHGVGMARLNDSMVGPLVRQGRLVLLLPGQFADERIPIYAVVLQTRQRLPKIRACIDYWAESLAGMATPGPTAALPSSG